MNLQKITASVNSIVVETGAFISKERKTFSKSKVSDKGLNQLVSFVDVEAEKMLVKGLSELLPEAGFITEENTSDIGRKTLNWIIDPLDGTTNFIHDVPVYSVSVALALEDEILSGTVYELGRSELFSAWKDGGAWCNGKPIRVSEESSLKSSLMATGFPYCDFEQMEAYLSVLRELMQSTQGLRRMGSAAVDLAYVACGRFEGFFEYGLNPWDVAGGCLLIKEAGGSLSDFKKGNDYLFGKSIAGGNAAVHGLLMEIIQKHF